METNDPNRTLDEAAPGADAQPVQAEGPDPAKADGKPRRARSRLRKPRWLSRLLWRVVGLVVLLGVVAVLLAIFIPKVKEATRIDISLPDSLSQLTPDEELGYNKFDFLDAILGETREKSELIVLEQDVEVSSEISHTLANISLFAKSQTLLSFGTGIYTIDLSRIGPGDIVLDEIAKVVSVTIPHAALTYVNFDVTKTESGETKRAIFGFGQIKLTTEQMTMLESSIEQAMREKLGAPEALTAADERALILVRELLDPLVKTVASEFAVKVLMG